MHPRAIELLTAWCEYHCHAPMETLAPRRLTGWDVVEALWPLNESFRPYYEAMRALPYDKRFEEAADDAIEHYITKWQWPPVSVETRRVLLERQQQGLMMGMLSEANGSPMISLPTGLPANATTGAVVIWLLYAMKLPWPAVNRSRSDLPTAARPERK